MITSCKERRSRPLVGFWIFFVIRCAMGSSPPQRGTGTTRPTPRSPCRPWSPAPPPCPPASPPAPGLGGWGSGQHRKPQSGPGGCANNKRKQNLSHKPILSYESRLQKKVILNCVSGTIIPSKGSWITIEIDLRVKTT